MHRISGFCHSPIDIFASAGAGVSEKIDGRMIKTKYLSGNRNRYVENERKVLMKVLRISFDMIFIWSSVKNLEICLKEVKYK